MAMMMRPIHESQPGTRLRADIKPMGMEMRMPTAVARMAIWTDSISPSLIKASLSGAKLGGQRRERNLPPCSSPLTKRSQVISKVDIA
jgi:hypothetical protein